MEKNITRGKERQKSIGFFNTFDIKKKCTFAASKNEIKWQKY